VFETILFPIDFNRETQKAIEIVANLVKTYNSKLIVLSVVESNSEGKINSETQVEKLLSEAREYFAKLSIDAKTIEREGLPAFIICDVADEVNADIIVMGYRGLGLIEDVHNSVTNQTIELSPCPVLVVP
jgi:nucleotide-binding universal stress UspA family protein